MGEGLDLFQVHLDVSTFVLRYLTCFAFSCSYTYNVCPFHNITQKEERRAWNSFHGVLGWVRPHSYLFHCGACWRYTCNGTHQGLSDSSSSSQILTTVVEKTRYLLGWWFCSGALCILFTAVPPLSTPTEFGESGWLKMTPSQACCLQWEKDVAQETEKQRCGSLQLHFLLPLVLFPDHSQDYLTMSWLKGAWDIKQFVKHYTSKRFILLLFSFLTSSLSFFLHWMNTQLMFNCSTVTQLHNASEPSTCKYTIWMDTPLACFKGAMQGELCI